MENIVRKGEIACNKQFLLFSQCFFSIRHCTSFSFQMHFKMLSAVCFNLDQSKILSSGNGLTARYALWIAPCVVKMVILDNYIQCVPLCLCRKFYDNQHFHLFPQYYLPYHRQKVSHYFSKNLICRLQNLGIWSSQKKKCCLVNS